ncbi:MAG: amidohydrolase family protein [Bryobacteraceae bacterium]
MRPCLFAIALLTAGCARPPFEHPLADAHLAAEIAAIKAIDNHAHVVSSQPNDHGFDALPVENLEPEVMPTRLVEAGSAPQVLARAEMFRGTTKAAAMKQYGSGYAPWVLDRAGIDVVLANRVAMAPDLATPRFRWVSYVDAFLFPLNNAGMVKDSDKAAFYKLEEGHLKEYLSSLGAAAIPASLDEYTTKIVTPTLEAQKKAGALAVKYEAAYLRALDFTNAPTDDAARVYAKYLLTAPPAAEYKILQDYLFSYIARECGRLGLAIHIHTGLGGGGFFNITGSDPMMLEPVFNDPAFRKTKFVLLHGGTPFENHITALVSKPNVYADFSVQGLMHTPTTMSQHLRQWLEAAPGKILFGTDAYPWSEQLGWEESLFMSANTARQALAIALTGMWRDGEVTHAQAVDIARMVLRDNARGLYQLP